MVGGLFCTGRRNYRQTIGCHCKPSYKISRRLMRYPWPKTREYTGTREVSGVQTHPEIVRRIKLPIRYYDEIKTPQFSSMNPPPLPKSTSSQGVATQRPLRNPAAAGCFSRKIMCSALLSAVAEKSQVPVGRQFRGRAEERHGRGTAPLQTFGRPVLGHQKPDQLHRVSRGQCVYGVRAFYWYNFFFFGKLTRKF